MSSAHGVNFCLIILVFVENGLLPSTTSASNRAEDHRLRSECLNDVEALVRISQTI